MKIPMSLIRKTAKKSQNSAFFHAAIVKRAGAVVAVGHNHGWLHAEKVALGKMWKSERKGCTLISVRLTKGGLLANAMPCVDCQQLIRDSGIHDVYYSTADRKMERMKL